MNLSLLSLFCSIFYYNINSIVTVYVPPVEESHCVATANLSSSYPESDIAKIELIENIDPNNGNKINFISLYDGSYQSMHGNDYAKKFTVKLTIFNTGCTGEEEIIINVHGQALNGDVDNVFVMSMENSNGYTEYFSVINDWDNKLRINNNHNINTNGPYMAPDVGLVNLMKKYTGGNNNLIDTMFDGITNINEYYSRLAGGDITKLTSLIGDDTLNIKVGYKNSPLRYRIVNYVDWPEGGIHFEFGFKDKDMIHNDDPNELLTFNRGWGHFGFDVSSGNDYIIGIGSDENRPKYDKFDITVKCYEWSYA